MSIDFTGITNQNEFYTNYYLTAIFEQDLTAHLKTWSEEFAESDHLPHERLGALRRDFFQLHEQIRKAKNSSEVYKLSLPFVQKVLNVLGFDCNSRLKDTETAAVPIVAEVVRGDGSPYLWAIAVAGVPEDGNDPLHQSFLPQQYVDELNPVKHLLDMDLETIIAKEIYASPEPPRWILALQYNRIMLIDRSKWSDKRLLSFDLAEILNRRETSTLKAAAVLLHKSSLCPESGNSLLDTLDENSHKHAFAVSEDLKYAAREAVELIGNEAIWYIREVQKKAVYTRPELAKQLSGEALRYLYRLLFLFYLEARAEKLGTIPMKNEAYKTGYSLESLRELEMVPLLTPEAKDGYFFDESITLLFSMISDGVHPSDQSELDFGGKPLHDEFSIDKIESHLFDVTKTPLLHTVKLRNSVWQQIIQLLSLSREQSGRNRRRGRVSYAQLGIIQLGAVYEGLLSYRGFFAENDLYEVQKAGENWNPLNQAFFVTAEQLTEYADNERVYDENGNLRKYHKGTFIYRLAGRDREKSASYYTPTSLTQCLVKYALKELIGEKPEDANYKTADEILQLTVCEPAMGSAAFLNEAVNQLADAYLRRKQQETGTWIAHEKIEEETQKVRMYLADRNIFGVDLNPVAVELGEISLWLNSMTKANFVPWFGGQLLCGNSLIGARRQVYKTHLASQRRRGDQTWLDFAPERVIPGTVRDPQTIYHFLLPDTGMADYTDRVIKSMAAENIDKIKTWKKAFTAPFSQEDALLLERLSRGIDQLWKAHTKELRQLRLDTTDALPIFGHENIKAKNLSLAEKDKRLSALYAQKITKSTPYRRLKMLMDYWCALWFWPIDKADKLPSRDEYLMELQYILQGTMMQQFGVDENGDPTLFPDMPTDKQQELLDFAEDLGTVNINELIDTFPRLKTVQEIAESQRFFHWELEYADIFNDHDGFDLVLGNPPWVKVNWIENGLLSDYQPMFAVKKLTATQVAELRNETIEKYQIKEQYFAEYESVTGTQNFLNALCNYPVLKNIQTNLFKCFLPQAWMIATSDGISAFLHPEGNYDDAVGGKFRKEIYTRLRDHFQFINELRLFADVHHSTKFSINIYGAPQEIHFNHIANLFAVSAIEDCFQNSAAEVGGIKDDNDQWNKSGHPDRVVVVTEKELSLFAQLYDEPGTPCDEARLPALHAEQMLNVLLKFTIYKHHVSDYASDYKSFAFWDETNDQKKTHTIRRETKFPETAEHMILSGPHFFVANPLYKTPRFPCTLNSDYDTLDLTILPENYLQRTNYVPDCDMTEYRNRTPYCPWDIIENPATQTKTFLHKVTDYYRIAFRGMIGSTSERTLTSAIIPSAYAHINGVKSICPRGCVRHTSTKNFDSVDVSHTSTEQNGLTPITGYARLLDLAAICFSSIGDFYVKSTGKQNLAEKDLETLPYIVDNRLRLRVLLLSCLTQPYADLWQGAWREEFANDGWAKKDTRLPKEAFSSLSPEWNWNTPLRTDYARRQALIEIDVLVARALGMTLDELCTIYRIQFPVLKQNENDTWYDQKGRIVFTCSKGLPRVGFDRPTWNTIKDLTANDPKPTRERNLDWLPEDQRGSVDPVITYYPPFDKCDRESDYRTAWEHFDKLEKGE